MKQLWQQYRYGVIALGLALSLASCATVEPEPTPEVVDEGPKPVYIEVAQRDAMVIGQKIWMNESSAKIEGLTAWNTGENFASLGIGHFIWYPAGQEGPYTETFPGLIAFLQSRGNTGIPAWLLSTPDCPWNSQQEFVADFNGERMTSLRNFLKNSIPEQVQFIIRRLETALPTMLESLNTEAERETVKTQFYRIAQTPQGVYALLDYINFKGEGTSITERYNSQGWGLLQVLTTMSGTTSEPLQEFVTAADAVLTRRVQNAPAERNEARWLPGWRNRLQTYLASM